MNKLLNFAILLFFVVLEYFSFLHYSSPNSCTFFKKTDKTDWIAFHNIINLQFF